MPRRDLDEANMSLDEKNMNLDEKKPNLDEPQITIIFSTRKCKISTRKNEISTRKKRFSTARKQTFKMSVRSRVKFAAMTKTLCRMRKARVSLFLRRSLNPRHRNCTLRSGTI